MTPWHLRRYVYLKFQARQQVATDPRVRHHSSHQSRRLSSRPTDQFHQIKHQCALTPRSRVHGSPHGAGGPRHHPHGGVMVERQNAPLPPHEGKYFHRGPIGQDVQTWHLRAHSAGALRQLVPIGTQGPSRPLLQGVSGGLVQDQCGLGDINIAFLAHSSLVAFVNRPHSRLAGIVVVNHFHLQIS